MPRGRIPKNSSAKNVMDSFFEDVSKEEFKKEVLAREQLKLNITKKFQSKLTGDRIKDEQLIARESNKEWEKFKRNQERWNKDAWKKEQDSIRNSYKLAQTLQQKLKVGAKFIATEVRRAGIESVSSAIKAGSRGIDAYLGAYSKYMSKIEARIQGSQKSFGSMTGMIRRNVGITPYVSQMKVLENLDNLVSKGISYNVEQRAFLQTISEKIATTFDAFDSNMAQIIRIQQADTTKARLGVEAELTRFLNRTFQDTSYLSDTSKSITGAILGATSQLGRDSSIAFEYNIQKWLGSLGSVGVSQPTLQQIAQGLNLLGTGDITGLTSNTQLQNLLLMGAQKSGIDYADVLTQGLTPTRANKILKGIVEFGQEIAKNTNQVVRAQYGQLFGLTMSDMKALLNLSTSDLDMISGHVLNYANALEEVDAQVGKMSARTPIQERINTLFENIMSGMGERIANNAFTYTSYLINDLIMKSTGGGIEVPLPIPLAGVATINLNKTFQAGIVGMNMFAELGSVLSGLTAGLNPRLTNKDWGASPVLSRGQGLTDLSIKESERTVSEQRFIGGDTPMMENSLMKEQKERIQGGDTSETSKELVKSIEKSSNINKLVEQTELILNVLQSWQATEYRVRLDNDIF